MVAVTVCKMINKIGHDVIEKYGNLRLLNPFDVII